MGKDQDLLQAVKEQDAQAVSKILNKAGKTGKKLLGSSKKFNINYQDGDGMSSLHQASLMGNTGIMRTLLEAGAQVGVKDNRGMTPLHYAAWQGQIDPVRLLLHWMAPCNEQAFNGDLPLHLACQHGHVDVVNALLSQHASPTARNKEYKTPLDLACEFGRFSVVEVLLNCNVCRVLLEDSPEDLKDNFRTTCIHSAAKSGHTDIIKLLLQARVNINRVTLQGTPLHEASKYCRLEAVRLLLDCGADVNKTNSYDQTPLDLVNKFTTTKAAKDLKKLLKEASFAVYVCAVKDNYSIDPECLSFKEGDYISVQEQNSNGLWKGYVVRDGYMARPKFFPADKVVIIDPTDPEHADLHYPNNTPQYVQDGLQVSMPTGRGRFLGSSEEMRSGLSKESLTYSNRNSSASCDSGRGVSTGQLDSRIACGVSVVPSQHRLSNQSYESGVSSGRRSCHSNSSSSMGSLDRLEESAYSSRVNVMQLFQSGHSDREVLLAWLSDLQFEDYLQNFLHAGYDMPTISRMTPEDLTAIGITKPSHRKRLKAEIARLSICDGIPDYKPADLLDWLRMLKLDCYYETLLRQGFDNMDFVTDIMWEDLEEIGIKQLGHQKKIMLAVDRLKRLTHGGKRLSSNDCQKSCESLDSPGSVLSVEMVPTPQYSQEVSITKINPKKSTSGENLCRASSGPEMTTFQQPRDMGLGLSASSLNSSEYACVYPVGTSDNTGDRSKSGSNTPVHMEDTSEHSGYVINNVDNLDFSPKAPSPIPPAVAPKPKPVAKIIGKSVSSVSHSSTSSSDSGIHGGDGSGQTTPTNTLKKHSTMQMNSANRREIVYAEPIKPSQVPSNSVPVSNFRSVSSPYGTLVSSHYSKSSEISNSTAPSSAQPRTADTTSAKINGPMPSVSSTERRDVTDSVFNSAVLSASTNITTTTTSNVPVDKTIYQSGGVKKKVPPPPPPKRSNSMTETTRTEKVSVDSWGEPPHSAGILHEDAFTSCVKNLSARFGKMREEKREENSVDTASSSDSEEFPPPPPPIAMEIMTPKLHSYGIIGKSALRDSPERTGSLMQKHGNVSRNASFGEWSGSVGTLPHKRSTDYERVRGELESATMMRPSKGANSRDCNGGNDLNVSTVSIDSNSLPFANENVGTIKQKVLPGKPSIVHSEAAPYGGERKVGLNSQMFDERSGLPHEYSNPSEGINHRPQLTRSPREMKKPHPAPPVAKKPVLPKPTAAVVPAQQTEDLKLKRSTETGDVLNDIDNMLADLTEELDAMLELEME